MSDGEASSIHTPIMTTPQGFTDLPMIPEDYLFELEDRYPALAAATRAVVYLRNPANSRTIAKRERRRMRLFLPPLKDTIEATYKSAFWAAYNDDNALFPQPQPTQEGTGLMFVM